MTHADDALMSSSVDLGALQAKAREAMSIEDDIANRLELVERDRQKLANILENELPKLMSTAGLNEFGMVGGVTVENKLRTFASVPNSEKKPEEFAAVLKYLDTHGAASLAKRYVVVELNREKKGIATKLLRHLKAHYKQASVEVKVTVHSGTYAKWIREKLEQGKELPLELLNASQKMVAKIKRPGKQEGN